MNYYTSDLHLNIIRFEDFESVEQKQQLIFDNWNKKVKAGDHVYILGDVSSMKFNLDTVRFVSTLKGNKHLIVGNHDNIKDDRYRQLFVEIKDMKIIIDSIKIGNTSVQQKLFLCHYPILAWGGQHRDIDLLYGHTHNTYDDDIFQSTLKEMNKYYKERDGDRYRKFSAYNVWCGLWDYQPVSLKEILDKNGEEYHV